MCVCSVIYFTCKHKASGFTQTHLYSYISTWTSIFSSTPTVKTSQAFVRFNAFHLPSTCLRHPTPLTCNPPVRLDGYIVKACTSHNTLPSTAASSASTSLSSSSPSASESSSSGVLHFYHTPPLRKLLGPFLTLFHPHVDLYTETIPIRLAGVRAAIPDNTGRKGATTMNDGRSHVDDEAVAGDCNHGERISGGPSPPTGGDSESEQAFVALLERKYVQIQLLERLSPPPSSAPSTATSSHATQRFQINNTSITVQNEVMQPVSCLCWPDQSFSVVRWLRGLPPLDAASELLAHGYALDRGRAEYIYHPHIYMHACILPRAYKL